MKETIDSANNVLSTLINKSVVEGALTIASVNALNFLVEKATGADVLSKENEFLKIKIAELETLQKAK